MRNHKLHRIADTIIPIRVQSSTTNSVEVQWPSRDLVSQQQLKALFAHYLSKHLGNNLCAALSAVINILSKLKSQFRSVEGTCVLNGVKQRFKTSEVRWEDERAHL